MCRAALTYSMSKDEMVFKKVCFVQTVGLFCLLTIKDTIDEQ